MGYATRVCGVLTLTPLPSVADPEVAMRDVFDVLKCLSNRRMLCTDVEAKDGDWDAILAELATPCFSPQLQGSLLILNNNKQPLMQPSLNCPVALQWHCAPDGRMSHSLRIISDQPYYCWGWLQYIICRVLEPQGFLANGQFLYQGDDVLDRGRVVVHDNVITCLGCAREGFVGTSVREQVMAARQLTSLFDIPLAVLPAHEVVDRPPLSDTRFAEPLQLPDDMLWAVFEHVGCTHSASVISVRLAGVCTAWRHVVHRRTRVYRLLDVIAPRKRTSLLAALPRDPQSEPVDVGLPQFPGVHVVDLCCLWLLPHQTTQLVRNVMRAISPAGELAEVILDGTSLQSQTLEALLPGWQRKGLSLSVEGCGGLMSGGVPEWLGEHVANGDIGGLRVSPFDRAGDCWIAQNVIGGDYKYLQSHFSLPNAVRMGDSPSVRQAVANAMGRDVNSNFFTMFRRRWQERMQSIDKTPTPLVQQFCDRFTEYPSCYEEKEADTAILQALSNPVCCSLTALDLGCIDAPISQLKDQLFIKATGLRSLRLTCSGSTITLILGHLPASLESLTLACVHPEPDLSAHQAVPPLPQHLPNLRALKVYSEIPLLVSVLEKVLRSLERSNLQILWIDGVLAKDVSSPSVLGVIHSLYVRIEFHIN